MRVFNSRAAIRLTVATALSGALLLTGCSNDTNPESASGTDHSAESGTSAQSGTTTQSDTSTFPATVAGSYGDVTVSEKPERIVALNRQMAEMLLELGIEPVAVADTTEQLAARGPWLEGELDPETLDGTLFSNSETNLEQIASYKPDLIVGLRHQFEETTYQQAQDIAPTLPGLAGDSGNPPWQESLQALATLTGTDAQPVIDSVDAACEAAREKIPQWQGKTYQWVQTAEENMPFGNGSALECLGLVPAENQINLSDGSGVSYENIDQLNADSLLIWDARDLKATVEADPRYSTLPSVVNGSIVWEPFDSAVAFALNTPGGPLSFSYIIDSLLPTLEGSTPGE